MTELRSHFPRRVGCAVALLFCTLFARPTWASVIYEFREAGGSAVIGTMEIASPPASETAGWSTVDPSDLIALHLDDGVFDLGTGNLLATAAPVGSVLSLFGSDLDVGAIDIAFPTIVPIDPVDPTINQYLSLLFNPSGGADFIGLSTISTINGQGTVSSSALFGDWTVAPAAVPEPGTAVLTLMGLAAARIARRKRRGTR